jgi:hypothetical protein
VTREYTDQRTRAVIALLRMCETLDRPREVELREGQVYVWCCPTTEP